VVPVSAAIHSLFANANALNEMRNRLNFPAWNENSRIHGFSSGHFFVTGECTEPASIPAAQNRFVRILSGNAFVLAK
jgi:hypothetical protein